MDRPRGTDGRFVTTHGRDDDPKECQPNYRIADPEYARPREFSLCVCIACVLVMVCMEWYIYGMCVVI